MADFDDPRPSSQPVGTTELVVAKDNLIVLDNIVNSDDDTIENRKGRELTTLSGLETAANAAIADAVTALGFAPLGDGTWAAGKTFTSYNQYLVYNGVPYKPKTETTLPYTTVNSDATADGGVEPFTDVIDSDYTAKGEEQALRLSIYPPEFDQTASITSPYNEATSGTNALRDAVNGKIYLTSEEVSGTITAIDFSARTATVGGASVTLKLKINKDVVSFDSVDELTNPDMSVLSPSDIDAAGKISIKTIEYHAGTGYGGWNASSFAISLADYRTEIGDPTWTPNGFNERYLYGGTTYVAMYKSCSVCDVLKYGHKRDNSLDGTALYVAMMDNQVKRILFPEGDYQGNITFAGRQGVIVEGVGQSNDRFDQDGAVRLIAPSEGDDVVTFGDGVSASSIACGVEHVCIDSRYDKTYSHLGRGIYVNVLSPQVVWRCYVKHVFIRGFNRNFEINCDINASECFNCDFYDVESIGSNEYGHKVRGVYNTYTKMFATQCEDFAFFNDGSNSPFIDIIGDGRMAFKGGGQHITNAVIEAIHTTTPATTLPALEINGNTSSFRGVRLNGVPKTIYNLGISVFGAGHTIENVVIQGANSPEESIRLNAGSSGVLKEVDAALTSTYIDDVATDATIQEWEFAGNVSDVLRSESFSWTPVLDRLTTSPDLTYSVQVGSYVKRRNTVTCFARISIASITTQGTGQWFISGLPFTAKAGSLRYSAIVGQSEIFEASGGYVGAGTDTILLTRLGALITANTGTGTIAVKISYETS